jgi:hypothetical protein
LAKDSVVLAVAGSGIVGKVSDIRNIPPFSEKALFGMAIADDELIDRHNAINSVRPSCAAYVYLHGRG